MLIILILRDGDIAPEPHAIHVGMAGAGRERLKTAKERGGPILIRRRVKYSTVIEPKKTFVGLTRLAAMRAAQ